MAAPFQLSNPNKTNSRHVGPLKPNTNQTSSTTENISSIEYLKGDGNVRFPTNIENNNNIYQFVHITASKYQQRYPRNADVVQTNENKETAVTMFLPLPREINNSYRSDWQTLDLGMTEAGRNAIKNGNVTVRDVKAFVNAMSEGSMIGNISKAEFLEMVNPYRVMEWRGPQQRTFSFTWDLKPLNNEDSDSIQRILWNFKRCMHTTSPVYSQFSLQQPYLWNMKFCIKNENSENPFLFKVRDAALTSLDIENTPHGHAFHYDGSPVGVRIHASFTETLVLSASDFGDTWDTHQIL